MLAPFVELGYRHVVFGFPAPYDEETMIPADHGGAADARRSVG